ncbi:MAG: dTDP-glucose 4,6-dehydratase [Gammaproteobacteria bacterium]|nr:dTDP-glucose 4,6-dehydratase [Gammaproteobacteria bacterium]
MKKILVIGSNSFSGATFSSYAAKKNYFVLGISRSKEPNDVFLSYKWSKVNNFKFHQIDINNEIHKLLELINVEKPQYIVNFAAQGMVSQSWDSPEDWFNTNTLSTIKLFNEIRKLNFIDKFIHVSTPEVYGSVNGFVEENYNFNPSTPYAVSRASADMCLRIFHKAHNFPGIITRAANVYGAGQQLYRIIPKTIICLLLGKKLKLHGGGLSTRSFIHMDDVCNATLKILTNGNVGESYHISTKSIISIKDLVHIICKKLDKSFLENIEVTDERLGKDLDYHLNSEKMRKLGWKDKIKLEDGIDSCIEWVKLNLEVLKNQDLEYIHKR